jgi:Family of unknown function (DUF6263)
MWLRRSLFAALVVFVGLSTAALGQDKDKKADEKKTDEKSKAKVLLAWKLEKGKTFWQKMTTKTDQTMKVMNQEVKQTQTQTFYFSFTPTEEKDNTWTIKQKIEGVQMEINIGGTTINYDSIKPETTTNPLGEFFKALVGSEFTLTVAMPKDKEPNVTKIEGRDDFVKKLSNANPQMQPLLNQILSEKALLEMAQPTFAALPNKEVAVGDTWTRTSTLDMGPIGKYETTYKYTYDGKEGKDDKIKVETTLKYKEPAAEGGVGGLPFRIKKAKLDTEKPSTGTIKYDSSKGRIESSTLSLDLSGELEIEIGGQTTKVDLKQTQKTDVDTLDKNPLADTTKTAPK